MRNIKTMPLIAMVIMIILSFTNLLGLNLSSGAVIAGVVFFFINKIVEKEPFEGSGLDLKSICTSLKCKRIWFWIVLPLIMDAICVAVSKAFLPEYIVYETARAGSFVAVELTVSSVLQFLFFALGEEIAWRAFFQRQLSRALHIVPVLLLSSLLFTLGHFNAGNPVLVVYGLIFTFINSILYGVIFHKTQNAWISTISHFTANIFELALFVLIV